MAVKAGQKLICGVGINDGKHIQTKGSDVEYSYGLWRKMLDRCYNKSRRPYATYHDCSVSEEFKSFTTFHEWAVKQFGFRFRDYHLDKDILVKGNKIYHPDYCVFIPRELNSFLTTRKNHRGSSLLIGVNYHSRDLVYQARVSDGDGKRVHLGYFEDELSAFYAYKKGKESVAKNLAKRYEDLVDQRVINSLLKYEVDIDD